MSRQIYVNLPVKDLEKSKQFFSNLGFSFEPNFSNEKAACMIIDQNIYVMLLREEFFKTFINKEIANTNTSTEVITAISASSREEVDEMLQKAIDSGGIDLSQTSQEPSMYYKRFQDFDGHLWEVIYMEL